MVTYRGLTWNHPRGFRALDESARRWSTKSLQVNWDRQSLEQFESRPITEICSRYDLVVLDHPHVGEAAAAGCLLPLEDWCGPEEIDGLREDAIGNVWQSYFYQGKHWALPLDAATQVLAYRADLIPQEYPLTSWSDVSSLSQKTTVVLSLAGPHALLTFFSICAAFGEPPFSRDVNLIVSRKTGEKVLELMSNLFARGGAGARPMNPVEILEEMATSDSIVLCPLVYGYVNYAAVQGAARKPVIFRNAPRMEDIGIPGSTLGGTGIAVSSRAQLAPELKSYLLWLVNKDTQRTFIPNWDGQPSSRYAWLDREINERWGGFYLNTAETVERALVRPRFPGYIAFQAEASAVLRAGLQERLPASRLLNRLLQSFESYRSG